ncbi:DNA invertase Pin-like site-specific DNA recombinase [Microbacterium resistens]|uniref:DNA invertase Pin-like site-specific DNA recombinase n=1 Tax=Microbacterium resistens TaxID=156977 RepID=A0ABU1SGG6_9MICO|nr:recombinase family protein [Microbacterium resistens]MDR6868693.1 DNA invertase Pin-like site-specific DNA recombinase [Microbacterium resistens]
MHTRQTARLRAVLYLRLSRKAEASTSIVRQNEELLALAEREDWDVVLTLTDDGKSGGKQRANAQHALAMLRRGEVDILAVYAVDRWSRMGIGEAGPIIAAVDASGGRFVAARESIDSGADPDYWKLRLAFSLDTAEKERRNTIARVSSSQRYLKEQGYWEGGRVPFGYAAVPHPENPSKRTLVIREREAAIARELAQRLANGELPSHLAVELTDRGVPTATSGYRRAETLTIAGRPLPSDLDTEDRGFWHTQSVQSIMTGDTLLGRRHEWVVDRSNDETGTPREKKTALRVMRDASGAPRQWWPAILTPAELEAIRAHVNNPDDRGKYRPRVAQRQKATRLLSGLVVCATCGSKLYAVNRRMQDGHTRRADYRCNENTSKCREKATIGADILEAYVIADHLAEFGDLEVFTETTKNDALATHEAALADVLAAIREATILLAEDATPDRFTALQSLQAQRDHLLASRPPTEAVYVPTGRSHAEEWATAVADGDIAYQRDLLSQHYQEIRITKGRAAIETRVSLVEHVVRDHPYVEDDDLYTGA